MARSMCVKCKKGHVSCQCSTTCKQCLTLGTLGDNGTCNCCKNCGAVSYMWGRQQLFRVWSIWSCPPTSMFDSSSSNTQCSSCHDTCSTTNRIPTTKASWPQYGVQRSKQIEVLLQFVEKMGQDWRLQLPKPRRHLLPQCCDDLPWPGYGNGKADRKCY